MNFKIYTDGASRGNPGPASAGGIIISPSGGTVYELSIPLGIQTNNYAEYMALLLTLQKAKILGIKKVDVFMDSKLVVEQVQGNWKINNECLKVINNEIQELKSHFEIITFKHIYRNLNKRADELANKALNDDDSQKQI